MESFIELGKKSEQDYSYPLLILPIKVGAIQGELKAWTEVFLHSEKGINTNLQDKSFMQTLEFMLEHFYQLWLTKDPDFILKEISIEGKPWGVLGVYTQEQQQTFSYMVANGTFPTLLNRTDFHFHYACCSGSPDADMYVDLENQFAVVSRRQTDYVKYVFQTRKRQDLDGKPFYYVFNENLSNHRK